jgi:hypothetical protein
MARYLCRAISKGLKRRRIFLPPLSTKSCSTGHRSYGTIRLRTIATGARAPEPQGSAPSPQWCPHHDSPVTTIRPCRRVTRLLQPLPPFPTNSPSTGHQGAYDTIRLRTIATAATAPEPQDSASRQRCPHHDSPATTTRPGRRETGLLQPFIGNESPTRTTQPICFTPPSQFSWRRQPL